MVTINRRLRSIAVLAAIALVAGACGGAEESAADPAAATTVPAATTRGYYDLTGSGEETAKVTALPQAAIQSLGWTGGGLESQATDVTKLLPGIIDGGLLTADSLQEMTTLVPDTDYGLGVNVGEISGVAAYFHGGGVPGFRTKHAYFPDSGMAVALLTNASGPDIDAMMERAAKVIFG
ncbi:MAG: serine hydrolase [Acidimicrobiia bacterium]|nr:serine hydrolase [Acidimicrobiia bacterium]